MHANPVEHCLAHRFHVERAPSLVSRTVSKGSIAFTHLKSERALEGRSVAVPREDAFSFHVPLSAPFFTNLWIAGKFRAIPPATAGCVFLFDLGDNPVVSLDTPFNSLRFYISRVALDELAFDGGLGRIGGLHARTFGSRDLVMYGLAQTLAAAMENNSDCTASFTDHVALAFHDHIVHAYGGVSIGVQRTLGGLAPWQIRRAEEYMEANINGDTSLMQLASECSLSRSYFAQAFKQSTGVTPHQWVTKRRLERAKKLMLDTSLELVEIAGECGFADQSHFIRVFSQHEGHSPGAWRRLNRRSADR